MLPLLALLTSTATLFPGDAGRAPSAAQNIIILLADDVGVDLVHNYEKYYAGHPLAGYENTTPVIDYLARTGLTFRNAWTNPSCSPSRAQLLTGLPAFRSGIGRNVGGPVELGGGLDLNQPILPTVLRTSTLGNYHSAAVGKWHLAHNTALATSDGLFHALGEAPYRWFDQYAGSPRNLIGQGYNVWEKLFATSIGSALDECTPPSNGFCLATVTDYATLDTADDAVHLIKTMPEPFFLYVPFNAPHEPLDLPTIIPERAGCIGLDGPVIGKPNCNQPTDTQQRARCMMQWLDNEVGRILCAVEADVDRPDLPTTIIFMGDNGSESFATVSPFFGLHTKRTVYDGGVHVPFIVKSPYVSPTLRGRSTNAMVDATDVFATVADIAGATLPADPNGFRDSHSILPILTGQTSSVRDFLYAERFGDNFVPSPSGRPPVGWSVDEHERTIRNLKGYKLIQRVRRQTSGSISIQEEFYHLRPDPYESDNLMNEVELMQEPFASNYAELRAELDANYPALVF